MRRTLIAAIVVAGAVRPAVAERLAVKVIEVAGESAYIDQGRAAGIVRGMKIRFGSLVVTVVETTEKTAALELGGAKLAVGAAGIAEVTPGAASVVKTLPAPRPAEAFRGAWPDLVVPAASQSPNRVPLGSGRAPGRAHVAVIGHAFATADRTGVAGQGELRAIASFDLLTERPLAADVDVAARGFTAGANGGARVPLFVRTAQVRYGGADAPDLALGRLRYAASSLGMLDGVRAAVRMSSFEVAAFGGIVPDPVSGKPDTGASRFGAEVGYDDATSAWQPRVALTGYGSTWDGELDERRLAMTASARRGAVSVDGWAEAQMFAAGNPWGAHSLELTGAGATAQWRRRGLHAGGDLTFLRPERSLRLAAALPAEWLCTRAPQAGDVPDEACTGGDSWASASLFAGARGTRWSVDAIGSVGRTNGVATSYDSSGYLAGELRFGPRRVLAGISGGRASFASWTAAHLGLGMVLSRSIDLAARYRPELLDYAASSGPVLQHGAVVDVHVALSAALDLGLSAAGTLGPDRDAAALLTTVAWRPLP